MQLQQTVKEIADVSSVGIALTTVLGWLPAMAAILSIVWTGIRIYEYIKTKKIKE